MGGEQAGPDIPIIGFYPLFLYGGRSGKKGGQKMCIRDRGKYDFAWLDKAVALAAKYDLKVIMCTSTATPDVYKRQASG